MSNFNWHPTKEGKVKFDIAVSYLGADHRNVALAVKTFQMAAEAGDLASRFNYSIIVLDPACSSHGSRKTAFQYLIELMLLDAPKAQDLFNDSFMSNDNQDLYDVSDIYYSKQEWSIAFSYLSLLYPRLSGVDAIKVLDRMITCCHSSGDYAKRPPFALAHSAH